jgi:hypothetical protein
LPRAERHVPDGLLPRQRLSSARRHREPRRRGRLPHRDPRLRRPRQPRESADAGFSVQFRTVDGVNFYEILVKLESQQALIAKLVDDKPYLLTAWMPIPSLRPTGINRTIVRCVGNEIRASINGQPLGTVRDDTFARGYIGFGAGTWGNPTTINFDNILVTTPTVR